MFVLDITGRLSVPAAIYRSETRSQMAAPANCYTLCTLILSHRMSAVKVGAPAISRTSIGAVGRGQIRPRHRSPARICGAHRALGVCSDIPGVKTSTGFLRLHQPSDLMESAERWLPRAVRRFDGAEELVSAVHMRALQSGKTAVRRGPERPPLYPGRTIVSEMRSPWERRGRRVEPHRHLRAE